MPNPQTFTAFTRFTTTDPKAVKDEIRKAVRRAGGVCITLGSGEDVSVRSEA